MLEVYGAVAVHQGAYQGVYECHEILTLVRQMNADGAKPGPYGAYWTYDGDAFFEECSIMVGSEEFAGRAALSDLQKWVRTHPV